MPSPLRLAYATIVLTAVALATPVTAVRQQPPADRVLPDFDIREGRPPQPPSPQAQAEISRATRGGPKRAQVHPFTGGIRLLERPGVSVRPTAPAAVIRNVVASLATRLGLEDGDLASLELQRDYFTQSNGLRTVAFAQNVDGLPVYEAIVTIHIDRTGDIVRITSSAGRIGGRLRGGQFAADQAVAAAAKNIRPDVPFISTRTGNANGAAVFARGQFRSDLTASLTWLPVDGVLRLAWHVTVEPESDSELYDVLIDATTGEVLLRQNRVHFVDGAGRIMQSAAVNALDPRRLDPIPVGQPGTGCPPPSNYFVRSLTAPFRDPATVLSDTGLLSGNNAHVFRGAVPNEGAMGTFDGTKWNFDFAFNTPDSAETALFFALNFAHDFFYDLGFDEAAGNFQVDNFNRGGLGGDPIRGNARADGRNNANYAHAPDGTSPKINMFLWDSHSCFGEDLDLDGVPDIDGDYDFDIILHEYHHGVSLRLASPFSGSEAGAIGEGGGDFFAYSVNGNTQLAEYVVPGGLRTVNTKTYAEYACQGFFCDVHDNGEIWANVLWDTRERFRIDRVRGTEASGINEVHQLYIDSLKLAPSAPSMLDMRDGILQDDALRNAGGARSANFCRVWESFAGRGMGVAAHDAAESGFNSVVADFSVPDGCVAPPSLQAVTVTAATPTANEAGPVPGAFKLTRNMVSNQPVTVQYTLFGTAVNGTDYLSTPLSATIPAGAAEVLVPITPIDDDVVESEETVQIRLRSGGPYVIGSPSTATITIVSDDVSPDLSVSSLTLPPRGASGLVIQVTDTTINQGTGPAPASTTSFYLSSNALLDATDPLVGTRSVPSLAAGVSSTGTTQITLPDGLAPGSYSMFALADGPGTVTEFREFNNSRVGFIQIGPDLTITAFSAPSTAGAGSTILVTDTTANSGLGTAAGSITRFYLSADFNLDAGDTLLQGRTVPSLDGGAASTGSTSLTIPASTADGVYYLIVKADGADAVPECNETNNTRSAVLRIGPDLVVSAATAPARAAGGSSIDVTETTQNSGTGNAGASATAIYLSANSLLDSADVRLATRSVPALAPGALSSKTTSVTLPAIGAGTWYLIVSADDQQAITETVETNNTRIITFQVGPDLTVASVTVPFTVTAGSTLSIGDSVKNVGAATAGASVIRFYLSANTVFDSGDTLLGERAVAAIGAGLTNSGITSVTIPSGLSGSYYLFAIADAASQVEEASEGNNTFLRLVQINPGQ